ncbi:uncharacterized protein N0V89_005011 [Didymosphaeria variabile]|uniref:Zn(2)-C6 fungal-type domain-containing protein n=1 Tax=Didymosphaeria variabile TaxID=1932322 RepID=A0A9W8XKP4_9PLEO|nr:uncharacterized protein N0V89_005011 [Didymosphaeria variabile]KAJ4353284.1 hypothetical protein N0V89_005011 [Didymosphaeria variabile]
MQAATSPSTVQASPSSTPHPAAFPGSANHVRTSASDTPKPRARLACHNCRRSKVRCGPNTGEIVRPCPQCAKSNKTCTWPDDLNFPSNGVKKIEPAVSEASPDHRLSDSRKRRKPPSTSFERPSTADGDIDNLYLQFTETIWDELYNIFRQHYATELPFLHEPTFLKDLKRTDVQRLPAYFAPLRLAFLALTLPFHPGIERQMPLDSRRYARKCAEAAEAKINFCALSSPSIEVPQALLILRALIDAHGAKSFILLGSAIKTMQLLRCQFDEELVDKDLDDKMRSTSKQEPREDWLNERRFILEETRRRTFWSCFIIDRYVSYGDYKPRSILMGDPSILVQLPCSEDRFDLGLKTKTRMLRESDEDFLSRRQKYSQHLEEYQHSLEKHNQGYPIDANVEWEDEDAQSPLVWLIKALDVFGDVMRYTCTITRRADKENPWDESSVNDLSFYKLDKKLDQLISKLPVSLKLTPSVRDVHIHRRRATPYVLLHLTLLMCKMALHREWLPSITFPKAFPTGPVDGPRWEELKEDSERWAPNFWKDIMWLAFFPNFDQDGLLCQGTDRPDELVFDNFEHAFAILRHLQERMNMARAQGVRLRNAFRHHLDTRSGYTGDADSPTEVKISHGLKKYLELEKDHKEFGGEVTGTDPPIEELPDLRALLRVLNQDENPTGSDHNNAMKSEVKSEHSNIIERAPALRSAPTDPPTWASVNREPSVSTHMSPPQQHYQHGQQHQYPSANQPSSFGATSDIQQHYATVAAHNYQTISKERVTSNTMDHHSNYPGQFPPANGVYASPMNGMLVSVYPNVDWGEHATMSDLGRQDGQTFSGDFFGQSQPQDYTYYAQQQHSTHPHYGGA